MRKIVHVTGPRGKVPLGPTGQGQFLLSHPKSVVREPSVNPKVTQVKVGNKPMRVRVVPIIVGNMVKWYP